MCLGGLKELSQTDDSFEHPQHMIWLRNIYFSIMHSYQEPCILHLTQKISGSKLTNKRIQSLQHTIKHLI